MVSGFFTSPCDHWRIFSGDASEMRMALKESGSLGFSKKLKMSFTFSSFLFLFPSSYFSISSDSAGGHHCASYLRLHPVQPHGVPVDVRPLPFQSSSALVTWPRRRERSPSARRPGRVTGAP